MGQEMGMDYILRPRPRAFIFNYRCPFLLRTGVHFRQINGAGDGYGLYSLSPSPCLYIQLEMSISSPNRCPFSSDKWGRRWVWIIFSVPVAFIFNYRCPFLLRTGVHFRQINGGGDGYGLYSLSPFLSLY